MLDTLAGRLAGNATMSGVVMVNGYQANLPYGSAAYVTQNNVLHGSLTAWECVYYAGMLRLPFDMTQKDKVERVEHTLKELGLEKSRNTYVGNWHLRGLSNGQRRRVSIACELVTNPKLFFLDEPTSGLDAAAAYHLASVLQRLASSGRTLVATLHQPSSEVFEKMDRLLLLSCGAPIYFGDSKEAGAYMEGAGLSVPSFRSLPDHLLHMVNTDFTSDDSPSAAVEMERQVEELRTRYEFVIAPAIDDKLEDLTRRRFRFTGNTTSVSWGIQFLWLTKRAFLTNSRNAGVFWLRLVMYLLLCICMGTVYFDLGKDFAGGVQGRTSLIFFVVAFLTFMSISAFPAFVEDMKVFLRERLNGYYGVGTFALADTVASSPFVFVIALVSTLGVYFLVGLNMGDGCLAYFTLTLFLALLTVESLMMMIAAIVPHFLMGIAAGAGVMGMFMIVCGFFQYTEALPGPVWRYPMHYMAFHTYAFSGLMRNEFEGTEGWQCSGSQPGHFACTMSGEQVLEFYQVGNRDKWLDVAVLLYMCVFYRIGFFVMLKLKEGLSR